MSRFQFVADHQHTFEVKRLCQIVEVSRSSFYAWVKAGPAPVERARDDWQLAQQIRAIQDPAQGGDRAYGAPRVTAELNENTPAQERVNHKRVARVMREHGLAGIRLRRRVRTTVPESSDQKVPDLLERDFTAQTRGEGPSSTPGVLPGNDLTAGHTCGHTWGMISHGALRWLHTV